VLWRLRRLFDDICEGAKLWGSLLYFGLSIFLAAFVVREVWHWYLWIAGMTGLPAIVVAREEIRQHRNKLKGHDGIYDAAEKERLKTKSF
jgi:hypothetical protein